MIICVEGTFVNVTGLTFSSIIAGNMFEILGPAVLTLDDIRVVDVSVVEFVFGRIAMCVVRNSVFERLAGDGISMSSGNVEFQGVTVSDCPRLELGIIHCFEGCVWLQRSRYAHSSNFQIYLHD